MPFVFEPKEITSSHVLCVVLAIEQAPFHYLERLQHLLPDHAAILHQSRFVTIFCLLILILVMRNVDRDHDICTLLLEPQQQKMNIHKLRSLPVRIYGSLGFLYECQPQSWFVSVQMSVNAMTLFGVQLRAQDVQAVDHVLRYLLQTTTKSYLLLV
jgi:hypothetical protein